MPPDADPGRELRSLLQSLFRSFGVLSADATPCGKPLALAEAHALMVLGARRELTQQELGRELRIDKSNVARLCARLVDAGRARVRVSESDRRSRLVSLSPSGKRLAEEVERASQERFAAVLGWLPAERRAATLASLRDLVTAVDALSAPREGEP